MKNVLLIALALVAGNAWPVSPADDATKADRARIAAERAQAGARLAEQEKSCYGKFAVNDCLLEARAKHREAVADLRRQEISLNDAERKRRSAERLRDIDARSSAQAQEQAAARRAQAVAEQKLREDRAAEKAARAGRLAAQPPKARTHDKKAPMPASEAAENARRHEERVEQARERKERMKAREAEKTKPPAASLPVPP